MYLYVKQHTITGLKYFGVTSKRNPFKYKGSGKYWLRHIYKHGVNYIDTVEIWGFDSQETCTEFALAFSQKHNIAESSEWANLIPEKGINGGGDTRKPGEKRIPWNKGKVGCYVQSEESNLRRSETLKATWHGRDGNRKGCAPWNKGIPNPQASVHLEKTREEWTCPHCGKHGRGTSNKHRWHFANCKSIKYMFASY
jgi:hypothetical protein